jgi:hypothetical protein
MESVHFNHPFRYAKYFPEMKGDWLFGSIGEGLKHVMNEAESGPENVSKILSTSPKQF